MLDLVFFFFFSSRRRHTRSKRDWSSDVCSSDLELHISRSADFAPRERDRGSGWPAVIGDGAAQVDDCGRRLDVGDAGGCERDVRSEERRVGKECRSGWWRYRYKKKDEGRNGERV